MIRPLDPHFTGGETEAGHANSDESKVTLHKERFCLVLTHCEARVPGQFCATVKLAAFSLNMDHVHIPLVTIQAISFIQCSGPLPCVIHAQIPTACHD